MPRTSFIVCCSLALSAAVALAWVHSPRGRSAVVLLTPERVEEVTRPESLLLREIGDRFPVSKESGHVSTRVVPATYYAGWDRVPTKTSCSASLQGLCAQVAGDLRKGEATLRAVSEIAAGLIDAVKCETPERQRDGSLLYQANLSEEFGVASLFVLPVKSGICEYEIRLLSPQSLHDVIAADLTQGSRLELRFSFDENEEPCQCSALALAEPIPSNEFYSAFPGSGWVTIGGALSADLASTRWSPVKMRLFEQGGQPCMRQEVFPQELQADPLRQEPMLYELASNLGSLRSFRSHYGIASNR